MSHNFDKTETFNMSTCVKFNATIYCYTTQGLIHTCQNTGKNRPITSWLNKVWHSIFENLQNRKFASCNLVKRRDKLCSKINDCFPKEAHRRHWYFKGMSWQTESSGCLKAEGHLVSLVTKSTSGIIASKIKRLRFRDHSLSFDQCFQATTSTMQRG